MNGLIFFLGGSFRNGKQGNLDIGSEESYNEQINASKSHVTFISHIINKFNMNSVSAYISSYHTKFDADLIHVYEKYLLGYTMHKNIIGIHNLFHKSIHIIEDINQYDFVLMIRIDLFLKEYFVNIFDPRINKILFPSITWYKDHKVHITNDYPRVNDTIFFVPKKYFNFIKYISYNNNCSDGHNNWKYLVENGKLSYDDIDTMINTYHDSDSEKDYNPLYYIVNREENKIFHSPGVFFNKYDFFLRNMQLFLNVTNQTHIKNAQYKKKRVAFCMRGAVAKICGAFFNQNELYIPSEYVDYKACYNSIVKHIIQPNSNHYEFDIFCHSWNYDLETEIRNLYKPVASVFEDNRNYNDKINKICTDPAYFSYVSQALTIKKSIELKQKYELENNFDYDVVILYRYDVLLWKDMIIDKYIDLKKNIYVNAHENADGDFHFLMDSKNSNQFKYLYDSYESGNEPKPHSSIKNYVLNYMKLNLLVDNIIPGKHQEVIRKIYDFSIHTGYLTIETFNSYK